MSKSDQPSWPTSAHQPPKKAARLSGAYKLRATLAIVGLLIAGFLTTKGDDRPRVVSEAERQEVRESEREASRERVTALAPVVTDAEPIAYEACRQHTEETDRDAQIIPAGATYDVVYDGLKEEHDGWRNMSGDPSTACRNGITDARAHCNPPPDDAYATQEWARLTECLKGVS